MRKNTTRTSWRLFWRLSWIGLLALAASSVGCAEDASEPPLDDEDASFGIGKADGDHGNFTACQLRAVLALVNESSTTVDLLKSEIGVHSRAASSVIEYRLGPDGIDGTADDNLFDDLAELDGVRYVGPVALEAFASFAASRCVDDLASRPFIHKGTFDQNTGGGWGRNAPEFEATLTIHGATARELFAAANGEDDRGRPMFNRLRRGKLMEAFSYGYSIDEMPWDSDSANAREELPFLALSIENGRFVADEENQRERELSLGTDIFDDIYYDTKDFHLLSEGMVLRGRVRYDDATTIRRLLIQAKSASSIDENGIKSAAKVDVRTDSPDRYVDTFENDVRSGTTEWGGSRQPAEPIKVVYDQLVEAGKLRDMDGYEQVLLLDPKAHLRSKRSRFHFNFTDDDNLVAFYRNGLSRVQYAVDAARAALDAGTVDSAAAADVEALVALGQGILDHSLIQDRAASALQGLEPPVAAITVFPEDFSGVRPTTQIELDTHQITAQVADEIMDEFETLLDDVDRDISGSRAVESFEDYIALYVEWQKSLDSSLSTYQTYKPFKERYENFVAQGDAAIQTQIDTFNAYREEQLAAGNDDFDIEPMSREAFDALGPLFEFEVLKLSQRMIRNGGTIANALWFEMARKYYIPRASDSAWSNFLIDTFDVTYFITPEEWARLTDEQRRPDGDIPGSAIFHTTVVNEVQIELTMIEPYTERIAELKAEIAANGSTPELERQLAGAQFVLDESIRTLQRIAELKGGDIIDELEDFGLDDLEWLPAEYSKGITAMRVLSDTD